MQMYYLVFVSQMDQDRKYAVFFVSFSVACTRYLLAHLQMTHEYSEWKIVLGVIEQIMEPIYRYATVKLYFIQKSY